MDHPVCPGRPRVSVVHRDEEFGPTPACATTSRTPTPAYVIVIPQNTEFTDAAGATTEIKYWPERLSPNAWQRRACESVRRTPGLRLGRHQLRPPRSSVHDPPIRRRRSNSRSTTATPRTNPSVNLSGSRAPAGRSRNVSRPGRQRRFDNYQVRLYHAWYRHITLAMTAQKFPAVSPIDTTRKGVRSRPRRHHAPPRHPRPRPGRDHRHHPAKRTAAPPPDPPDPGRDPPPVQPP